MTASVRYAALKVPGVRWRNDVGHEMMNVRVGVEDLFNAGADLKNPKETKLVSCVKITGYKPSDGWLAEILYSWLDPYQMEGKIRAVGIGDSRLSGVLDESSEAVEYIGNEIPWYEYVPVRSAGDRPVPVKVEPPEGNGVVTDSKDWVVPSVLESAGGER